MTADTDARFMRLAIACARPRVGRTGSNPAVGCVLIAADGQIAAMAATAEGGRPHAEEQALDSLRGLLEGGTAYVTLEPCGTRSSGGLSCSEKFIAARLARVVIACSDPSPLASGLGLARLAAAGVQLERGCLTEQTFSALNYAAWILQHLNGDG